MLQELGQEVGLHRLAEQARLGTSGTPIIALGSPTKIKSQKPLGFHPQKEIDRQQCLEKLTRL